MFGFSILGATAAAARLATLDDQIIDRAHGAIEEAVDYGETLVKRNASGRPGPIPRTGAHRRSIRGEVQRSGAVIHGQIGSGIIYAARLERGYIGYDRAGRYYNYGGHPYLRPAVPEIRRTAVSGVRSSIRGL